MRIGLQRSLAIRTYKNRHVVHARALCLKENTPKPVLLSWNEHDGKVSDVSWLSQELLGGNSTLNLF
jgi:hypothetical protein